MDPLSSPRRVLAAALLAGLLGGSAWAAPSAADETARVELHLGLGSDVAWGGISTRLGVE